MESRYGSGKIDELISLSKVIELKTRNLHDYPPEDQKVIVEDIKILAKKVLKISPDQPIY